MYFFVLGTVIIDKNFWRLLHLFCLHGKMGVSLFVETNRELVGILNWIW